MPDAHVQQRNKWTYRREYLGGVRAEESMVDAGPRVDAEPRLGDKPRVGAEPKGGGKSRVGAKPSL